MSCGIDIIADLDGVNLGSGWSRRTEQSTEQMPLSSSRVRCLHIGLMRSLHKHEAKVARQQWWEYLDGVK